MVFSTLNPLRHSAREPSLEVRFFQPSEPARVHESFRHQDDNVDRLIQLLSSAPDDARNRMTERIAGNRGHLSFISSSFATPLALCMRRAPSDRRLNVETEGMPNGRVGVASTPHSRPTKHTTYTYPEGLERSASPERELDIVQRGASRVRNLI